MEKFHISVFLNNLLEDRDLSKKQLSELSGVSIQQINKIMSKKANLNYDVATKIGSALSVRVQTLINFDVLYRQYIDSKLIDEKVSMIYKLSLLSIEKKDMLIDIPREFLALNAHEHLRYVENRNIRYKALTKRNSYKEYIWVKYLEFYSQKEQQSDNIFNKAEAKKLYSKLLEIMPYLDSDNTHTQIKRTLNDFGVKLIIVPKYINTNIKGALIKNNNGITIGISGNNTRIDGFIQTVMHEVKHITNPEINEKDIDSIVVKDYIPLDDHELFMESSDSVLKSKSDWIVRGINPYLLAGAIEFRNNTHNYKKIEEIKIYEN